MESTPTLINQGNYKKYMVDGYGLSVTKYPDGNYGFCVISPENSKCMPIKEKHFKEGSLKRYGIHTAPDLTKSNVMIVRVRRTPTEGTSVQVPIEMFNQLFER